MLHEQILQKPTEVYFKSMCQRHVLQRYTFCMLTLNCQSVGTCTKQWLCFCFRLGQHLWFENFSSCMCYIAFKSAWMSSHGKWTPVLSHVEVNAYGFPPRLTGDRSSSAGETIHKQDGKRTRSRLMAAAVQWDQLYLHLKCVMTEDSPLLSPGHDKMTI